jgi:hypothetical protein
VQALWLVWQLAAVALLFVGNSAVLAQLTIVPTFDSSITDDSNAATIEATIDSAIAVYAQTFSDPITVSITFQEMSSGLGESSWYYDTISYSTYLADLTSHATTTADAIALANLPAGRDNPVNGSKFVNLQLANARALGINAPTPSGQTDGTISLNTSIMNLSRSSTDPTKYDLMSTAMHEIDEVLGIGSALTGLANGEPAPTGAIWPSDLFRYDQNGARSLTTSATAQAYFSLDGKIDLAQFNQHAPGDFNDWYSYPSGGHPPQVQDAYATPGATPNLGVEIPVLDAIGYTPYPPALPGDVNHDGIVNAQDIAAIASNWLATGYLPADANGDFIVNAQDIAVVASHWLQTDGGGSGGAAAVPEPTAWALAVMACGSLALARRRRK